jgi:hypothetical protein
MPVGMRMSDQMRAFGQRAILRSGPAALIASSMDVGITCLVAVAIRQFGLHAERNREGRRVKKISPCSLIAAALARHGIHLSEKQVGDIWRSGDLSGIGRLLGNNSVSVNSAN